MKYAIFGAGTDGKKLLRYLGDRQVLCFIDNKAYNQTLCDKEVISYSAFLDKYQENEDVEVLIATSKHHFDIEQQIIKSGYTEYSNFDISTIPAVWKNGEIFAACIEEMLPESVIKNVSSIGICGEYKYIVNYIKSVKSDVQIIFSDDADCLCKQDLIIINKARRDTDIRETLIQRNAVFTDITDAKRNLAQYRRPELKKFKNIHEGKRIFVIGNGPSLKVDDLETLWQHNEITIGANYLYKIYDKTEFRASYLGFADQRVIEASYDTIDALQGIKFINDYDEIERGESHGDTYYFTDEYEDFLPNMPGFSEDVSRGVFWGGSVTYEVGIQFAAYMGASEIYLIGIDHNYVGNTTNPTNHFIKDYFNQNEKSKHDFSRAYQIEKVNKAYEMAEIYSRANGFRIFNATRGGKLEIFERVDFDGLFQQGEA